MKVYCHISWLVGFACVFIGSVLNLVALPFCDLVLFSSTIGIGIVFNNVIAMWWLGEKLIWKYDLLAFVLVVGGSTAIILLSIEDDEAYTPARIKSLVMQLGTLIFVTCTLVLLFVALFSTKLLVNACNAF